jgi:hypothetical protein
LRTGNPQVTGHFQIGVCHEDSFLRVIYIYYSISEHWASSTFFFICLFLAVCLISFQDFPIIFASLQHLILVRVFIPKVVVQSARLLLVLVSRINNLRRIGDWPIASESGVMAAGYSLQICLEFSRMLADTASPPTRC